MPINTKISTQYQGIVEIAGDPQNPSVGSSGTDSSVFYTPTGLVSGVGNDNTAVLQSAINYAATNGVILNLPAGWYEFTNLYLYYDASLNPGYPNHAISDQGRLRVSGQGRIFITDTYYGTYKGTILKCTSSTGGIHSAVPSGGSIYRTEGYIFKELSILGNTSGTLVDLQSVNNIEFKNVFILNSSLTGSGCYIGQTYIVTFDGFEVICGTAGYSRNPAGFSSGKALWINGNGGFASGNFTVSNANIGLYVDGLWNQVRWGHFEPHHCNIGAVFDGTEVTNGIGFNVFWAEGCTYSGLKTINGATLPAIGSCRIEQAAGDWTVSRVIAKVDTTLISGGNIYNYTQTGTTSATTGPTGTGSNITDGTAVCKYVGSAASEERACINIQDACTPSEATRTMLGDLYLVADCGTSGFRETATVNSQQIEINSLTIAASGLAFAGHTARTGIKLSNTGQPGNLFIKSSQFIGFDSTDTKCTQFSHLAEFSELKKAKTMPVYNTGSGATLSTTYGGLVRVLDNTTTITALEGQYPGTIIHLYMTVSGIHLTHSSTLVLQGSTNYTSAAGDILTFINTSTSNSLFGNTWTEVSRSVK